MFKNILTTFSSKFLIAIINFLLVIVTSKLLGASIRGEISLVVLGLAIITMLSEVVGGPALIYLIPKTQTKPLLIPGYLWGFISAILVTIALKHLQLIPEGYATHIFILGFLATLKVVNNILLFGQKKVLAFNLVHLIYFITLFSVVFYQLFVENKTSLMVYIFGLYAASIAALIMGILFTIKYSLFGEGWWPHKRFFAILLRNGIQNQLANVFHVLTNRINFYIIGSTFLIGIYSTAISFTEALLLFSGSSAGILMAEVANEKSKKRSQRLTLGLAKVNFVLALFGWLILVLIPNEFFTFVLGKDFFQVKEVILFLGPGICLIAYKAQLSHYFSGLGKVYVNAWASFSSLVVNIALAIVLIPKYQLVGAAISASLSYVSALLVLVITFNSQKIISSSYFLPKADEIKMIKKKMNLFSKLAK